MEWFSEEIMWKKKCNRVSTVCCLSPKNEGDVREYTYISPLCEKKFKKGNYKTETSYLWVTDGTRGGKEGEMVTRGTGGRC